MLSIWDKKNIKIVSICIFIIFLLTFFLGNFKVYATPTDTNVSISEALDLGLSEKEIRKAIKKELANIGEANISVDEVITQTSSYREKVSFDLIVQFDTTGGGNQVYIEKMNFNLTKDELHKIENGSFETNDETEQEHSTQQNENEGEDDGLTFGLLFEPIAWLLKGLGDVLNKIIVYSLADSNIPTLGKSGTEEFNQILAASPSKGGETVTIKKENIDSFWLGKYWIPFIPITPAEIFSGKVAALDGNIFKDKADRAGQIQKHGKKSPVEHMKKTIAEWYVSLRRFSIVALMCVLLYIGIRIIVASNNGDKAKYKQFFADWIIALCLIFFLHYIMSFEMTLSEELTKVFDSGSSESSEVTISVTGGVTFGSNFTGVARMKAEYDNAILSMGYAVMYLALTCYTLYFSFIYLKRLLMLCFFTIIAPLVSITYPIDKMKDSKAQAFNYWFKEYTFYAFLQPLHMLLYKVFVSSALAIASDNMLLALVALAFIVPAEKILKQMFNIKGQTESSMGGFAGGMLASKAFDMIGKKGKQSLGAAKQNNNNVRYAKNPNQINPLQEIGKRNFKDLENGANLVDEVAVGAGAAAANAYHDTSKDLNENEENGIQRQELDGQMRMDDFKVQQNDTTKENPKSDIKSNVQKEDMQSKDNVRMAKQKEDKQEEDAIKQFKKNIKDAAGRRYKAAGGAKGIGKSLGKKALKGTARGIVKGYGMATLGAIGLSAGIVGGDMADTLKGAGAGIAAGSIVGNKVNNAVSNSGVGSFIGESFYGKDGYDKKKFMSQYSNSKENRERVIQDNPNFDMKQIEEQLNKEAQMMYDTGITDYSDIKAAVKMEDMLSEKGMEGAHEYSGALAKLGKNYDMSTFVDRNKFDSAQKALEKKLSEQFNQKLEDQLNEERKNNVHKSKATIDRIRKQNQKRAEEQSKITLNRIGEMKKAYK